MNKTPLENSNITHFANSCCVHLTDLWYLGKLRLQQFIGLSSTQRLIVIASAYCLAYGKLSRYRRIQELLHNPTQAQDLVLDHNQTPSIGHEHTNDSSCNPYAEDMGITPSIKPF